MQYFRFALHALPLLSPPPLLPPLPPPPAPLGLRSGGVETVHGRYTLPYDGLRVVATQGFVGRRKELYRPEFILALKMIGVGEVARKDMRSSWAGATGLPQFLPSEFYQH